MEAIDLLHTHLMEECPFIHGKRLQALMDVACSLQKKQNLSLTAIGKGLSGETSLKHKIKKSRSSPQRRRFFHSDRRTFFHSLSKKNYNLLLDFFKSFCLKLGPFILIISE